MKILYTDAISEDDEELFVVVELKEHAFGRKKYAGISMREELMGQKPILSEYGLEFFSKWADGLKPYQKDVKVEARAHQFLQAVEMDEEIEE